MRTDLAAAAQIALDAALPSIIEGDERPYDVFWLENEGPGNFRTIPWADSKQRPVAIEKNEDGLLVNAEPLPDGTPTGAAKFAGCIRRLTTGASASHLPE